MNEYFLHLQISFSFKYLLSVYISMNYKECPIRVYRRNYRGNVEEIDAEQLVKLVGSHQSHDNELTLKFDFGNADGLEFDFKPNWDLIGQDSLLRKEKLCHFEAYNPSTKEYSTLSACNSRDISGLIRLNERNYILGHSGANFYFFVEKKKSCDWTLDEKSTIQKRKRRQIGGNNARMPQYYAEYVDGIKRWVELVFIADNTIYKKYEEDEKRINDRLHSIASTINSLYAPLNIRVTLIWADIWKAENPIEVTENADKTLRDFLTFRKKFLAEHPHDNAQLLTNVHFGSVIGKAYKGTMCSYDYSGGVIVDHSDNPVFVGMTVAHEMGHNFGMDHDVEQCKCPVDSCIMAAASSNANATSFFSDCSLDTLSSALRRGVDYCLHNVPKMAFGGAKCGNGILEDGEDCDCGTGPCPNKCCIAAKCKLSTGAECADGDCCNLEICKLKPQSIVCRQSINGCDLPEYCDGKNPSCPADFFVQDGHKCPNANVEDYCYQGICGSRKQQCQFIWGPTAENAVPECYALNEYGSFSGNCGHNKDKDDEYIRCKPSDVTCGRLQCDHESDKPVFGDPSTVYAVHNLVRTKAGKEETCRVVKTTLTGTGNRKADPGMVPDGAKCGKDRICVDASCRNKSEVLQMVSRCEPENCNGKGICNNVGNCHCVDGYGGVGCDLPGFGGSVNSGPAHDDIFNPGLALFYLSIFLVVIFAIASVYCRRKMGFWIHKRLWSKARVALDLRSFNLVPTRRAPPPPGTQIRHTHRQSWGFNAVWDPAPGQGEILHVDASRPYILGGGRSAVVIKSTDQKAQKQMPTAGNGRNEMPTTATMMAIAANKPIVEERRKAPPPPQQSAARINKKAEEERALVMGYDTGKSSSSNESSEPPPPAVPPHRSSSKTPPSNSKPKIAKKPKPQADGNSKIDVKALAARFEKK